MDGLKAKGYSGKLDDVLRLAHSIREEKYPVRLIWGSRIVCKTNNTPLYGNGKNRKLFLS